MQQPLMYAVSRDNGYQSNGPNLSVPNLTVRHKGKGCFQAYNIEYVIATMENRSAPIMYMNQESSCCIRFFCGAIHPFEMKLHQGISTAGPVIASWTRPFRCHMWACKCCCHQEISSLDSTGKVVGKTTEDCWYCKYLKYVLLCNPSIIQTFIFIRHPHFQCHGQSACSAIRHPPTNLLRRHVYQLLRVRLLQGPFLFLRAT